MACSSCSTKNGQPKGCKNNGTCGTDSCNKLSVFDWLANMKLPSGQKEFDCFEIRFKNDRKEYYRNTDNLKLQIGDVVAVEAQNGHDIGVISLKGELVKVKMRNLTRKKKIETLPKIYRKANEKDINVWKEVREKEQQTMMTARRIAVRLGLEMKISDVEYQGDGNKVIFYYTAEGRVDFRVLIREYASSFNTRIEMKQIGYRQEAAKVGGIGSCGRELCCSTWLTDFRSVSTTAARYQQLSINPQKLAGQCGKLKCCLNYELDSYLEAIDNMPSTDTWFETENGKAICMKIDVFKKQMWFTYAKTGITWHQFHIDDVREFVAENKRGNKVESLEDLEKERLEVKPVSFGDVIGEDSIDRFDRKHKRRRNRKPNQGKAKVSDNRQNSKRQTKSRDNSKRKPESKGNQQNQTQSNSNKKRRPNKKRNQSNRNNSNNGKNQNKK